MFEVYYCTPSAFGPGWSTGSTRFATAGAFLAWVESAMEDGREVLITAIVHL